MELPFSEKQAKDLDIILKKLVEIDTYTLSTYNIKNDLLPEEKYEYCLDLFYKLKSFSPSVISDKSLSDGFWASEYTSVFLHNGGFTAVFSMGFEKQSIVEEKEKLNLEKLRYDVKNAKRVFKTYWWTFGISILAFLFSIFNLIKGCSVAN